MDVFETSACSELLMENLMWFCNISGGHKIIKASTAHKMLFNCDKKWSYNPGGLKIKGCKIELPLCR